MQIKLFKKAISSSDSALEADKQTNNIQTLNSSTVSSRSQQALVHSEKTDGTMTTARAELNTVTAEIVIKMAPRSKLPFHTQQ